MGVEPTPPRPQRGALPLSYGVHADKKVGAGGSTGHKSTDHPTALGRLIRSKLCAQSRVQVCLPPVRSSAACSHDTASCAVPSSLWRRRESNSQSWAYETRPDTSPPAPIT